jgi:CHAT domain-containing protein/tetratricopeptide (TPR) repeat protein
VDRPRIPAFLSTLILAFVGGCVSSPVDPPQSSDTQEQAVAAVPVPLEECPDADVPWQDAMLAARKAGELEEFVVRSTGLAAACPGLWAPRWAAGDALYMMRDRAKLPLAREHYRAAMELARATNSAIGVARCANTLGGFFVRERAYEDAERIYLEGLEAARAVGRTDLEAFLLNNQARMLRETGRFAEAVLALQRARPMLKGQRMDEAALSAGYNESVMLLDLGNTAEAKERLEEVFATAVREDNARVMANSSVALGNLHRLQNQTDTAREWFERVADGDRRRFADLGLARIALAEQRYDLAEEHLKAIIHEPGIVGAMAQTLQAEITFRRGDVRRAIELARRVVDEATEAGGASAAFSARTILGKCLLAAGGRDAEAISTLRLAVEKIEQQSEGLTADQEGVAYLRERAEPYADLAAALALTGADPGLVFDIVERAHARALRRVLGGADRISGASLAVVQASLEENEVLLTYLVGQDRGTVVAATKFSAEAHVIDGLATLRPLIRDLRRLIIRTAATAAEPDLATFLDRARELQLRLIGPVEHLLTDAGTRLLIVPDQDLALVPFGALPATGTAEPVYLAERLEIAVLPMAGGAPSWGEPRLPLLLAGDPLPDGTGEFEALPTTRREVAGIAALWNTRGIPGLLPSGCVGGDAPVTRLQRERLTGEVLRGYELSSFRTIHFATHAVASSLDPRRCAVILSKGEKLSMNEIAELDLGASLIVLSACRTGEGEIIPGEGVVGLTWAFLHAGAKAVAASLWSVEDESTAELMLAFHGFLRAGHDPVAAMARAQRERMKANPHPAFWSPFVVVLKPQGG